MKLVKICLLALVVLVAIGVSTYFWRIYSQHAQACKELHSNLWIFEGLLETGEIGTAGYSDRLNYSSRIRRDLEKSCGGLTNEEKQREDKISKRLDDATK